MRLARLLPLVALALLALVPASAQATVSANMQVKLPPDPTVGQTGLPASISLLNTNSFPDANTTNTVCNAGDASPPCVPSEPGISVVPSCQQSSGNGDCAALGADPGVFALSATGTGRADSACPNAVFDIASTGDAFGTVRFVPRPAGSNLMVPPNSSTNLLGCVIEFTVDVLKVPRDSQDFQPGTQTLATGRHTQHSAGGMDDALTSSNDVTISRGGSAAVATTASPGIELGAGSLTDSATVSGVTSPQTSATVEFKLYGPDDATCAGAPVFTSTKSVGVSGSTATATSDAFTPTAAGTYRWIASYSGDANNLGKAGACNDANESTAVTTPTTPPGGGGGGGGGGDPDPGPKPVLSAFRFSPSSFKAKKGSAIKFNLNKPAVVNIAVARSTVGRRVGARCRATTKANRKRPKCTRLVVAGLLSRTGTAGSNTSKFHGRVGGKLLKPGHYRASATALDSALQGSALAKASFKVKKP
jgi:hypothetical protein